MKIMAMFAPSDRIKGGVLVAKTYDFIIAGGGSAACVAAMRLVRDFGFSVLIIERGPRKTAKLMAFPPAI